MKTRFFQALLLLSLCLFQWGARSEDIDLFTVAATGASTAPNLLFVMDNGANFNGSASGTSCVMGTPTNGTTATTPTKNSNFNHKAAGPEQCAIFDVIQSMPVTSVAKINIGIMMFKGGQVTDYLGNACPGAYAKGGCLVYPLTGLTDSTKIPLLNFIRGWTNSAPASGESRILASASDGGVATSMQEAWAYYAGKQGLSGTTYTAPPVGCSKNFVVYVGNNYTNSAKAPSDNSTAWTALSTTSAASGSYPSSSMLANPSATTAQKTLITPSAANLTTSCGTVTTTPSTNDIKNYGWYGDEWARYMQSQSIITYSIGFIGSGCDPKYAWVLESMATYGGGKYFETTDKSTLTSAFKTVISEVQSVNSAFAAVSLPVSVNTQGTYLNQVFVGMFRPDRDSLPRWMGNLKQYKMGYVGSTFQLLDADNAAAISSSGSDFIAECARSYWTPALTAPDSYWSTQAFVNCTGYAAASNTPDGNTVEKGGQGYKLRAGAPSARVVKTCLVGAGCTGALSDFNVSFNSANMPTLMGVTSGNKDTVLNWARGQNTEGEAGKKVVSGSAVDLDLTDMRPSVHGDVVHSRPVAINFGTDAAPKVVVFYGGNDGLLRAVNGNRDDPANSTYGDIVAGGNTYKAGQELWAFMPPEFYSRINRRYVNQDKISTPDVIGTPKDYGMDGSVTGYVNSSGDAWIYAGMRRGGRALYAFNVNHTTLAISGKWKVGCDSSGCFSASGTTGNNGDFADIGQTWTNPKIFLASGYGSGSSPLLIMGGGYDATCEDASSYTCGSETGDHIYVMDADTGKLLKVFNTVRGVTGDVLMLQDSNGKATYGYATDLGGNVYRISGATANAPIGSTEPGDWTMTKIAMLGCGTPATTPCTAPPNRKFIFGPDVVVEGGFNIILVGSGDREKPINLGNTVQNYFFMLKDVPSDSTWLTSEAVSSRCGSGNNVLCLASLATPVTAGRCATPSAQNKGWVLQLAAAEQVVTSAITVTGTVYFSTHQPVASSANVCSSNLGRARAYAIKYTNAASTTGCNADGTTDNPFIQLSAGGLPPSPVAGRVKIDDGSIVPFVIGATGPLQSTKVPTTGGTPAATKIRSYWYIQK